MTELAKVYTLKGSANQQKELVYDEENLSLKDQITDIFIAIRPILIDLIKEDVEIEKKQEEGYEQRKLRWQKRKKKKRRKNRKRIKLRSDL